MKTRRSTGLSTRVTTCLVSIVGFVWAGAAESHDHTLNAFLREQRAARAATARQSKEPEDGGRQETCLLTIDLVDEGTERSVPGLVRITDSADGKAVRMADLIERGENWYAMPGQATVTVQQARLKIESIHGLETELATQELDLRGKTRASVRISLRRFFDARDRGLYSGNTHLHLRKLTLAEAVRYLRVVPGADQLDLVFLSHLRRVPDERDYISNSIVEESLAGGELKRLSEEGVLFSPGEEHRHNFTASGEGYGHVMFLDIVKLIRPVSIGPGIMGDGTDGIPLQHGIKEAHRDGASVLWCHNAFGLEDLPNWMAGLLDAQNIFDGGNHGSYRDTFYRYLNLGMKVPFSTGTDWFIFDFSRVYVPVEGELTSKKWLDQLAEGKTLITNGPFLELEVGKTGVGGTIEMDEASTLVVTAHGAGRRDFKSLELVQNGEVIHSTRSKPDGGHFTAEMNHAVKISEPGWLALRIPSDAGKNEFNRGLFAHTSPVYVELAGRRIFQPEIARQLIAEIEQNMETIREKGKFASESEREAVLNVHRDGITSLRGRINRHQAP